jgi:hypothetical protein
MIRELCSKEEMILLTTIKSLAISIVPVLMRILTIVKVKRATTKIFQTSKVMTSCSRKEVLSIITRKIALQRAINKVNQ